MLVVVIAGLTARRSRAAAPAAAADSAPCLSGLALVFVLLTYGGWNDAAYLTAEMRDTRRGIVRALMIGILIITVVYLLLNLAYLNALGLAGIASRKRSPPTSCAPPGATPARWCWGSAVVTAALSTLNATVFTGARTNYALGRDFALFGFLGAWHERAARP